MNLQTAVQQSQNLSIFVNQLTKLGYIYSASSDESELIYTAFESSNFLNIIFFNISDNFISLKSKLYHVHINKNINSELELIHSASAMFEIDRIVNGDVAQSYIELVNTIINK